MEEHDCCDDKECGCGKESGGEEEMDVKDSANLANDKIDALIALLLKKNIIAEKEYDQEYDNLFEGSGDSGEEDSEKAAEEE